MTEEEEGGDTSLQIKSVKECEANCSHASDQHIYTDAFNKNGYIKLTFTCAGFFEDTS